MESAQDAEKNATVDLADVLDGGDGAVVKLEVGATRLAAHSAVLAARSPVLAGILEASGDHITIPGVDAPVLRQLVAYCYTLRAPRRSGMTRRLLAAADAYGISGLKVECERRLAAQPSVGTEEAADVLGVRSPSGDVRSVMLIQLAELGSVAALRALLEAGADVEARDEERERTALHWAAMEGHTEAVRCLLEGGAQLDARDRLQATPLFLAALKGRTDVVQLLLDSSADMDARAGFEWTPLHVAAYKGHAKVIKVLLEARLPKRQR